MSATIRRAELPILRVAYPWLLVTLLSAIWFALAAVRPITYPDEGRYAEIPREMFISGDWVTPHLNDLIYLEKPPLQYWATAFAYSVFGVSELSARLWTATTAWLGVLMVFLLGRRLWSTEVGVLAALFLASGAMYFTLGQVLTLDMAFATFLTAMLACFCMAQHQREAAPRDSGRWMLASWAMLALATLTKGIVALVIAFSVLCLYVAWQRDRAALRALRPGPGPLIFLLIAAPWFVLVARANPGFLHFFFVGEHFTRYLTDAAQRIEPWWYFAAMLPAAVLPWTPQLSAALLAGWRAQAPAGQFDAHRLLWLWCVFIVVFFTLSRSKLASYILPALPALAVLAAAREPRGRPRWLNLSAWIAIACAAALVALALARPPGSHSSSSQVALDALRPSIPWFTLLVALAAVLCWQLQQRGRLMLAAGTLAIGWFLGISLVVAALSTSDSFRSGKALAALLPADLAARAPIFSVNTYDQTLPFYLQRTLILVDTSTELDYGLRLAPHKGIDTIDRFEERWRSLPEAIAVMPHATYEWLASRGLPMRVLGADRQRVAVSRR
jgi:4-amino-4-deoxy-L-arabinose transferase-like glycosyltransferase